MRVTSFAVRRRLATSAIVVGLAVLAFALLFSFIALTVQFDRLRMPALILGCMPACLAGGVLLMPCAYVALSRQVGVGLRRWDQCYRSDHGGGRGWS